ncbi:hypothetical protein NLJ89_g6176 [Agrocybe chaxingu]|uniref:F-box domain-containing protein n=1 Tax=Agrocybe chaxingu TaxID=84603 RepID=A0A9W8MW98_9AGAR|nr:hypothetical protein NLJ89_g6176 [Agrocybe chaxingu]
MRRLSLKHGIQLSAFLALPDEILDEIVSELDQHRDLVSFALTSKACAATVIPHHTQYRILRVRHTLPDMWAHLARRSDLARNVREVHICERHNYGMPDHYPTTLIDKALDGNLENAEESVRIRNLCLALGHMQDLRVFSWSWRDITGFQRPTSHPAHENAVLTAVARLPRLETLSLNGRFAMHAMHSALDPKSLQYPVWRVANLQSLTLSGDTWSKIGNAKHLVHLLSQSPNLEYLEVPMEFVHLADCTLPKLKKLKLLMQAGASMAIDHSRARFLQNHPSIEELNWSPIGNPCIPPDTLPNLKSLVSNRQFIVALNDPGFGSTTSPNPSLSLLTPPSTPISLSSPPSAPMPTPSDPDLASLPPLPPTITRPIESLDVAGLDAQMLLGLKCIDRSCLRKLKLHTFGDISTLHELAETFPNIEWLWLPPLHLPSDASYPVSLSREQWLEILPRFTNLQVFRGPGLWSSIKNDKQTMHELLMDLIAFCPNLREVDHCDFYEKFGAFKRVQITRLEGEDGHQHVTYAVAKPNPRYPLDVMDGAFA